ncbi:MAG: metallophosphoesterase [Saccharofermentanales bacterium]|jgi:predicted phosphohydrolase
MKIFALADLHLSFAVDKPMAVFGQRWANHEEIIRDNWRQTVEPADLVLVPGDISWAVTLTEAMPDLRFIDQLPGQKLLLKGNHDYWWQSISKITRLCRDEGLTSLDFLQNDARLLPGDTVICGTRGWLLPMDADYSPDQDDKILRRELLRLEMSLAAAHKIKEANSRLLVMMHYPPLAETREQTAFTQLLEKSGVTDCVFGHIHHPWTGLRLDRTEIRGIRYTLVASDQIGFAPKLLFDA